MGDLTMNHIIPVATHYQSQLAKNVLKVYNERLHLFEAGDTLDGGVITIAAYGHTPGHTVFQKDSILVIADLVHGAALQMQHPEYCPTYDMDADAARQSRLRILEYARRNGLTMYGMHLPSWLHCQWLWSVCH